MTITIKNAQEIEAMRAVGRLAGELLDYLTPLVRPGITTNEIDRLAEQYTREVLQAESAPFNYAPNGHNPYPKSICTSINHQVCHGIPNDKPLRKGDIVNIDVTPRKNGWHGDSSRMFIVGEASIAARRLCALSYEALWHGIVQVRPGGHLGDIGAAIARFAEGHGLSVVRDYCGHGIGRAFHEEPQVMHFGKPGTLTQLRPGMTLTIEPMLNAGRKETRELSDGWTVVTKDHSLSAQWEHTILVTETGYEVLTLSAGAPPVPDWVPARSP